MADVQLKNGSTRIAHELLEALARVTLPARHLRVVLLIARLTYGRRSKSEPIPQRTLAESCGVSSGTASNIVRDLMAWNVITSTGGRRGPGGAASLGIQKDYDAWHLPAKGASIRPPQLLKEERALLPSGERAIERTNGATPPPSWVVNRRLTPPGYTAAGLATITPALAAKLREIGQGGFRPEWDEIAAWFAYVAPRMNAGGVRNLNRAAVSWWKRKRDDELDTAVGWVRERIVQSSHDAAPSGQTEAAFMAELGSDRV